MSCAAANVKAASCGDRVRLSESVRVGLCAGEFRIAFQPIIHAQTQMLDSVECLLRWQHPRYGLLLPDTFKDAFDDPVVAHEVTRSVLDTVCRQLGELKQAGCPLPSVAINIQPSQLLGDQLVNQIVAATGRYGIEPSLLNLEIVENEEALQLLMLRQFTEPLRDIGVGLALDDFGTGYSSLAVLARASIDSVKLAREFLGPAMLQRSDRTMRLVKNIITLLDELGLKTIVEGVETREQRVWLSQYPGIRLQGYYVGKPTYDFPMQA